MGKLFCWQLLIVGNFTFDIYVVLLIVRAFTFAICVVLLIVGNFDFACNVRNNKPLVFCIHETYIFDNKHLHCKASSKK
jgi:hypothetical protein